LSKTKYPYTKKNGKKIRVHRLIMEEHLGRELLPHEHVYHINGDGHDNEIENLIIITKKEKA